MALAACGGGGGGDDTPAPPPAPQPEPSTTLHTSEAQTRELNHGSTSAALAGSFAVQFNGGQQPAWSAQSDQPWLVLSPASGAGSGTVGFTVDTGQLADVPNWSSAVAQVRIRSSGFSDAVTTLTLDMRLPEVTAVWPTAITAGQAGTVRVRGRGLSQLASVEAIQIPGAAGVGGTITSDAQATLTLPALPQGGYAISVANPAAPARTVVQLTAVRPLTPATITAPIGAASTPVVFDAARTSLFASPHPLDDFYALGRVRLDGSQWTWGYVELPSRPVQSTWKTSWLAETPDGRSVYAIAGPQLLAIDPATLAIQASHPLPSDWQGDSARVLRGALTQDLRLWFAKYATDTQGSSTARTNFLAYFDLRTQRFERVASGPALTADHVIGMSADGSRLVAINAATGRGNFVYDAATSQFSDLPALPFAGTLTHVSMDGQSFVVDGYQVYTQVSGGLYRAQMGVSTSDRAWGGGVLSADGRFFYTPSASTPGGPADRVLVFDAAVRAIDIATPGPRDVVGSFSLPEPVAACTPEANPFVNCRLSGLQISPTGDTLVWPAARLFVVAPIPAELQRRP